MIVRNFLIIATLILTSFMAHAMDEGFEDVTLLARIHSLKDVEKISGYAAVLEEEGLNKILQGLEKDDEVLLKGSIRYHPVTMDNKTEMRPTFHINKIVPVSLKRLGKLDLEIAEPKLVFSLDEPRAPKTIPVSGKVATAMTLTASILLLQNLTSGQSDGPRQKLESQVLFGAGALATGSFIWDQIHQVSPAKD